MFLNMILFCHSLLKVALIGQLFSWSRKRYFISPVWILLSPGLSSKGRIRSCYFTHHFEMTLVAMLGVIWVCTRSHIMIFGVIEVLLSVNQRALGPGSSCKPITIYGTYVRICMCTPLNIENISSRRNSFGLGPHFCQQNEHVRLKR